MEAPRGRRLDRRCLLLSRAGQTKHVRVCYIWRRMTTPRPPPSPTPTTTYTLRFTCRRSKRTVRHFLLQEGEAGRGCPLVLPLFFCVWPERRRDPSLPLTCLELELDHPLPGVSSRRRVIRRVESLSPATGDRPSHATHKRLYLYFSSLALLSLSRYDVYQFMSLLLYEWYYQLATCSSTVQLVTVSY